MNALQLELRRLLACSPAVAWAGGYNDAAVAWRACRRGDWLIWLAASLGVQREVLVRAACGCARLSLSFTEDERPLHAILMAEQWAGGIPRPSLDQVQMAENAAMKAWRQADRSVTMYAVYAAVSACRAASAD